MAGGAGGPKVQDQSLSLSPRDADRASCCVLLFDIVDIQNWPAAPSSAADRMRQHARKRAAAILSIFIALEAFAVMHPPCKRENGVQLLASARVTSPTAEAMRSDRIKSEFKSPVTHQFSISSV
jgi:hypothetical protein